MISSAWGYASEDESPTVRCAKAVTAYAESSLDEALVDEIQSRPADFLELVSYEVRSLLSEESDVSTLKDHWDRVANFLPDNQVPYRSKPYTPADKSNRLRRLVAPAVQSELDQLYYGNYAAPPYREQLTGERTISDLAFVAWPRLTRVTNDPSAFAVSLSKNPSLVNAPRVVVCAQHLNKPLLDQTTRVAFANMDLEWPFPTFTLRTEPGMPLTVHFLGGTVDQRGGQLLSAMLTPSLKAGSVGKVAVRLRSKAGYMLPPSTIPMWEVKSQFYSIFELISGGHNTAEAVLKDFTSPLYLIDVHYSEKPTPTLTGRTRGGIPFEATLELQ